MSVVPPTAAELDTMIRARLASLGIDLSQLHPTEDDPVTGSPSQASVLASLRSFMTGTVAVIAAFRPPAAAPGADPVALGQQSAPPALYPSITTAWTA